MKSVHALLAVATMSIAGTASAANLTSSGFAETFDEMGTTGTTPPAGWAMYEGESGTSHSTWTTSITANGATGSVASMVATPAGLTAVTTPSGTNNNGFNAALSASNTADRVLTTSPTGVDGAAIQLTLTNNTGAALDGISISYDTDRLATAASNEELPGYELFYSTNGSSWTNVVALNPTLTTVPNTLGVTPASDSFNFATPVAAGGTLELRWVDDNAVNPSPDPIIGLNNVEIAPVPLPAGFPLLVSALVGLGLFGRRSKLSAA